MLTEVLSHGGLWQGQAFHTDLFATRQLSLRAFHPLPQKPAGDLLWHGSGIGPNGQVLPPTTTPHATSSADAARHLLHTSSGKAITALVHPGWVGSI